MVKIGKIKMLDKLFYFIIGFIVGILVTLWLLLKEFCGKLNIDMIKKLWEIFKDD
jgi:hypothetical protein